MFRSCDAVIARPFLHDRYNEFKLARTLSMEDEAIFLLALKRLHPEYEQSAIDYLYGFRDHPFNMMVMRREVFERYCEFTFGILGECSRLMRPLPYTCSSRRLGYIAEYLLPIFCLHNRLRLRLEAVVPFMGERAAVGTDWKQRLKIVLLRRLYDKHKPRSIEQMVDRAVLVGLKADGIDIG